MKIEQIIEEIMAEIKRAEEKHPGWPLDPIYAAAIVSEESGELARASIEYCWGREGEEELKKEAVQVGAMAIRFLLNLENYPSIGGWEKVE